MSFAVVFDLDGVLVDLVVDIDPVREQLESMFAPHGYSGGFRPILASIDRAAQLAAGGDETRRAGLRAQARSLLDHAEIDAARRTAPRVGALQLLERLSARSVALGLVTNNGRVCAEHCMARMPGSWNAAAVVTRDDVERWKPDPEGLMRAASALLPAGGQLWFIGDSPTDVEAARAADALLATIHVCGVLVGQGDGDIVVSEVGQVGDLIASAEAIA